MLKPMHCVSLLLAIALTGCECEVKTGKPGSVKAEPTTAAPTKSMELAKHAAQGQLMVCTAVQNKRCAANMDHIGLDVAEVFASLETTRIPKTPQATMVWIAEETAGAAPPNFTIATKQFDLSGVDLKQADHVSINGSLTRPTKGWPAGRYHVEVRMDGEPVATRRFEIRK